MRTKFSERFYQHLCGMLRGRCPILTLILRKFVELMPGRFRKTSAVSAAPPYSRPTVFNAEDMCCSTPPKYRVLAWQLINLPLQRFFVMPPLELLTRRFSLSQCKHSPQLHLLAFLHKRHIWHQSSDEEQPPA
jgi:hypothetical protein